MYSVAVALQVQGMAVQFHAVEVHQQAVAESHRVVEDITVQAAQARHAVVVLHTLQVVLQSAVPVVAVHSAVAVAAVSVAAAVAAVSAAVVVAVVAADDTTAQPCEL